MAITQRNEKNRHGSAIDVLEQNYVNFFEKFGIKLIAIPNSTSDIEQYFTQLPVKALIITGGGDVDPKLYGGKRKEGMELSSMRDATEKKLMAYAVEHKLPVLGICRGCQFINVFFGGKVITGIKDAVGETHVGVEHGIKVVDASVQAVLGKKGKVNSYHDHGMTEKELAKGLKPFALSEKGVIEGYYHESLPIAAIIWHPERKSPDNKFNAKIIKAFMAGKLFWKARNTR
ncbi:gamma-glutamyl-gamma-aminobutyrate hydrolase family protein [Candidatus Woesearchaeota archaeon]|nr:gamma-glutamyl-gamma-aminobutyrate hydrolase family protein [Candidatus Woesearchaeota archaeon]